MEAWSRGGGMRPGAAHSHFLAIKAARKPLVPHVAEAVQRQLRRALFDEDRREGNLLDIRGAAKVVDQVGCGEEI